MKPGRPSLFGTLFRTGFFSSAAVILGVLFFSGRMMLNRMEEQFNAELLNSARFTAAALSDTLSSSGSDVRRMVASVKQDGIRLTVVARDGQVLADSDMVSGIEEMKNHALRPEIQAILTQGAAVSEMERYSASVRHHMRYLAVPVKSPDGRILGVCRVARSMESVLRARDEITGNLAWAGIGALFFCGFMSWRLSRKITAKVRNLTQTIRMVREGDLGARIIFSETADTAMLSEEFDFMLNEFKTVVNELCRERTQFHAVLDGMTDGILALDASGIVLLSNCACRTILGIEKPDGKMIQEKIRIAAFNKLIEDAFREQDTIESDLLIPSTDGSGPEKNVLAHAVSFAGEYSGAAKGVLVVLTDVTRLRQLENVRRDFAANVSHELRTPVTAILGFVETLLNGALDEPENARRFLKIIHAHTYRLGALINDIMALARIERDYETCQSEMTVLPLSPFLLQVEETWRNKSAAKNIHVRIDCPEELSIRMNDGFFVQAVGNLLDNAVTYSSENSEIIIRAGRTDKETFVQVQDSGRGIPAEHLPRIFERFYTVDKARSRVNGGTGLGLAIVKHIVQIHGGTVSVESEPNHGTIFTLHFPITA